MLPIGEVARRARVNVQTIRYYERVGLIPRAARRSSGHREFPERIVDWIRFVKIVPDPWYWAMRLLETVGYAWLVLAIAPMTPPSRHRWCTSPVALVAAAAVGTAAHLISGVVR